MKFEYKTVDLRSAEGVKKAEQLKAQGWKVLSSSPDVIKFEREIKSVQTAKVEALLSLVEGAMDSEIEAWIEKLKAHIEEITSKDGNFQKTIKFTKGQKFYKVIIEDKQGGRGGSSYCFIDMEGNIYKAASWNAPVKGIRGNIKDTDVSKADQYTGWLYRRG